MILNKGYNIYYKLGSSAEWGFLSGPHDIVDAYIEVVKSRKVDELTNCYFDYNIRPVEEKENEF